MTAAKLFRTARATAGEGAWAPLLVFTSHVVLMTAFDAYRHWPPLDVPMHALGGVAIAFFFHRASVNASRFGVFGPFHPFTRVVLVAALTCTAAVVWEWAEFASDRLIGTGHQPGVADTMLDLFFGETGGLLLLALLAATGRLRGPAVDPPVREGRSR